MARSSRPDPFLLALGSILGCAPTAEAVLVAAAAARQQRVLSSRAELEEVVAAGVTRALQEQLLSDREVAKARGVHVRTWQLWVQEIPALAALAEPGPGPRRWRMSRIAGWQP